MTNKNNLSEETKMLYKKFISDPNVFIETDDEKVIDKLKEFGLYTQVVINIGNKSLVAALWKKKEKDDKKYGYAFLYFNPKKFKNPGDAGHMYFKFIPTKELIMGVIFVLSNVYGVEFESIKNFSPETLN